MLLIGGGRVLCLDRSCAEVIEALGIRRHFLQRFALMLDFAGIICIGIRHFVVHCAALSSLIQEKHAVG